MTSLSERADPTSLKLPPREEKHERAVVNRGSSLPCSHATHTAHRWKDVEEERCGLLCLGRTEKAERNTTVIINL